MELQLTIDALKRAAPALETCDANETQFLQRELTHLESTVYLDKEVELRHRQLIPVSNEGGPGLQSVNYQTVTKHGQAKIIGSHTTAIPKSGFFVQEFTKRVYNIADSFGVTQRELRSSRRSSVPLQTTKASAMRRAIRKLESTIAFTGDTTYNIIGLLNNPNITQVVAPLNGGASSRLWEDKTAAEILADVSLIAETVITQSKEVHRPTTLVLPTQRKLVLGRTRTGSSSDRTLLDFILTNRDSFGISEITTLPTELDTAFSGTAGALCYEKDPENLTLHIPMEMILHPPQRDGLDVEVIAEEEIAGTVVRYPLAFAILTGI